MKAILLFFVTSIFYAVIGLALIVIAAGSALIAGIAILILWGLERLFGIRFNIDPYPFDGEHWPDVTD
ncbi:hypothetical protein GCM10027299_22030 [Larkinella ripae]